MECDAPMIHVLLVSYPAQGHINPLLRLAKSIATKGFFVTFVTTENVGKDIQACNNIAHESVTPIGEGFLKFVFFQQALLHDDYDDDDPIKKNSHTELVGRDFISQMIQNHESTNHPISCIINNPFYPWVSDVAAQHHIPSAILWPQSVSVFILYHHYFHKLLPFPSDTEPYISVKLPSLHLKFNEIPDFLLPTTSFPFLRTIILEQFKYLSKPFCLLVDSFEELEHDSINYISKFVPIIRSIGPLFKNNPKPSPTTKTSTNTSTSTSENPNNNNNIQGHLFKPDDCIEWLNSRPITSVIYISFGSLVHLPQEQVDEIAYGLVNSKVSFLWVLKLPPKDWVGLQPHVLPDGFLEKTSDKGKVVQWSPQEQVLAHPSVACFLTHCGWNSTIEALASGVPVLTFPSWGDQITNAKFLVDVFGVGVRLGYAQAENKLVSRDEVEKCLVEAMVGPKAEELKKNAFKWKKASEASVAVGGSSYQNLNAFLEDIKKFGHHKVLSKSPSLREAECPSPIAVTNLLTGL